MAVYMLSKLIWNMASKQASKQFKPSDWEFKLVVVSVYGLENI